MKKLIDIQIMFNGDEKDIKSILKELTEISKREIVTVFKVLEK